MSKILKIAGATVNLTPIAWEDNFQTISKAIQEAKNLEVDLLCFPELSITGYGCEDLFLSNWVNDKALHILQKIIPICENITVCVGLPIEFNNKTFNCTAVIQNKQLLGLTAKQNLAKDGVHYEYRWFTPWPKETKNFVQISGISYPIGDLTYAVNDVVFGFEICEDAWVEDRPGCRLLEQKVDLILNPSASHFALGKSVLRENLVVESSKKFNCTYLYVNLLGNEAGRMIYDGEIIIAQKGNLIAKNSLLSFNNFEVLASTIDFSNPSTIAINTSFSTKNEEFTKATTLALFDYMRKSKSRGFVLSLSGGADSSTCAVLVAQMIHSGIEAYGISGFLNIIGRSDISYSRNEPIESITQEIISKILTCAYQATSNSSSITLNAAKSLANSIGATFYNWSVDDIVKNYSATIERVIGRKLNWDEDDVALQNIQARSRSPIIWMLANIEQKLLITTSNRSEGDVGYATMDGDTSGSIAPISGVDKVFVRQWLHWAENELGYYGLKEVNQLDPTAELRPLQRNQTDEDDLMPYTVLVQIEKLAIGQHLNPLQVFEKLRAGINISTDQLIKYIVKFYQLWSRNQWKRERIAPGFHLDEYNIDPKTWCRFPILSSGFEEELAQLKKLLS